MNLFGRKIHVTLIDASSNRVFAQSKVPADSLPESFHADTTLHIGDEDWSVVEAEPPTRTEYSTTKKLTIRLRRIALVPTKDVLFSLPSIIDALPELSATQMGACDLWLHEDDWRQMELVSHENSVAIERQFAAIHKIHEEQSVAGAGWRKLHKRTEPSVPITSNLQMNDVRRAFDGIGSLGGVAFGCYGSVEATSLVADGFGISCNDGLSLYGVAPAGRVTTLGIVEYHSAEAPSKSMSALVELAREFDLDLVHWCRCQREAPFIPGFRKLIMWGCDDSVD